MTVENNTFPQSGDPDDATRLAQLVGHDSLTDYVGSGLHLDADFEADELTISEGVFYTSSPSDEATSDGETILDLGYVSQLKETTIDLPESGSQYVVVDANVGSTDSPLITLESDLDDLPTSAIEIGEVSVDDESVVETNRESEVFEQIQSGLEEQSVELDDHTSSTTNIHGVGDSDVASVGDIEDHRENSVHEQPQVPDVHGNDKHENEYVTESEASDAAPVQSINDETGDVVLNGGIDPRKSLNRMAVAIARVEFEQGLSMLDYSDGQYEIYATDDNVEETSGVEITYGATTDDEGFAELDDGETTGEIDHATVDMGVIPDTVVHVDEVDALPEDTDITYRLTDENDNTVDIERDDLDSEVDLSEHIETFGVSVTATFSRPESDTESPVLDSWSLYLTGEVPDGAYFDVDDDTITTGVEDDDYFEDGVYHETSNYELDGVDA